MKNKQCPVDPGKLLIGLECCSGNKYNGCYSCPYKSSVFCLNHILQDAWACINYLEEQLNAKADNTN